MDAVKQEERSRTPSPSGGTASMTTSSSGEMEVQSPIPASTGSTTSSEPSHSYPHYNLATYSVPNPFANAPPAPAPWARHSYPPAPPHPRGAIPMVVSTPAPAPYPPPQHSNTQWAREVSCPNFAIGTTEPKSPGKAKGGRRRSYSKASSSSSLVEDTPGVGDSVNSRRQKRLERNRESARLSRRRRKHYLEILEERVTQLSTELDQGRRAHAAQAVAITLNKRREVLEASPPERTNEERVRLLEQGLRRTSPEMMLVTTFKYQQLKSFSLPPQSKFVLWLTLQNDQYFRGGRAASERLSAARIGERMLNSGNDRVPPAQSMWPLFCNEVGLSYDQEERVRLFQRTLLQSHESWLQRHSARAADLAMAAVHDSTQAMSLRLGQRERSMLNVLSPEQKIIFLSFAEKNREKLHRLLHAKASKRSAAPSIAFADAHFPIDKKQHVAASLYIINHRLQNVMLAIPRAAPLVVGGTLKKLSRRPSFESLGRSPMDKPGKDGDDMLSREHSYGSSGSLMHSTSSLSMDNGERPQLLQISPDDAEETCKPSVEKVLGYLREIIPPTPPPQYNAGPLRPPYSAGPPPPHYNAGPPPLQYNAGPPPPPPQQQQQPPQQPVVLRIPSPTQVISAPYRQPSYQPHYMSAQDVTTHPPPAPQPQAPVPMSIVSEGAPVVKDHPGHKKQSSFIPPYLNVVPEEMFPNDGTADEFLMSLVDEDWAIGEGIDMDTDL